MTPRAILLELLGIASAWQAAAFKARPVEPDAGKKLAAERKLAAAVGAYFARLDKKARAKLAAMPTRKATAEWWDEDEFWDDDDFFDALWALLWAAQKLGALSLPAMLGLDLNLNLTNKEAEQAAREYAYDLIKDLTATARETIQTVIAEFVTTPGMTIGDVIERLPFSEARASLIATTEITRAYATGQAAAGEALREQFPDVRVVKEWHSSRDELVCEICDPLDGVEVGQDDDFGGEFDGPPGHPGCRCWVSYRTRING